MKLKRVKSAKIKPKKSRPEVSADKSVRFASPVEPVKPEEPAVGSDGDVIMADGDASSEEFSDSDEEVGNAGSRMMFPVTDETMLFRFK